MDETAGFARAFPPEGEQNGATKAIRTYND